MKPRIIGVTGPEGFVAGHLIRALLNQPDVQVLACPRETWDDDRLLADFVAQCDAIVHLAGKNRGSEEGIYQTNISLVDKLVMAADLVGTPLHIVFASSTQRDRDHGYGRSKKYGEVQLAAWAAEYQSIGHQSGDSECVRTGL